MSRGAIDHTKDEYRRRLVGRSHSSRDRVGQTPPLIGEQQGFRAAINAEAYRHQPTALSHSRASQCMGMARSGLQACLLGLSKPGDVEAGLHGYMEEGNRVLQRHFGIEGFKLVKDADETA